MNIDFGRDATFSSYVLLLLGFGAITLLLASPAFARTSSLLRAVNALVGMALLSYGFYLAFLFHGGQYLISFKAFMVPAFLVFNTIVNAGTQLSQTARSGPRSVKSYPLNSTAHINARIDINADTGPIPDVMNPPRGAGFL